MKKPLSRREFLRSVAGVAGALSISPIMVACSPAATQVPAPAQPTATVEAPKKEVVPTEAPKTATPLPVKATEVPQKAAVKVRYWDHFDATIQKSAKMQTDKFNSAQSAVLVEEEGFPEQFNVAVWTDDKTGPDLASLGEGQVQDLISQGALFPLDTIAGFDVATKHLPKDVLASLKAADGHVYGLPYSGSPVMMVYNKKLFKEAGIAAPPKTWSEALDAAKKLTKKDVGQYGWTFGNWGLYGADWWMPLFHFDNYYLNSKGALDWVGKDGTVKLTSEPHAKKVLEFFKAVGEAGVTPRATDLDFPAMFKQGKVGMADMLPVLVNELSEEDYGIAPLPVSDDRASEQSLSGGYYSFFSIFGRSKAPEETMAFLGWLLDAPERSVERLQVTGQLPVRDDNETNSVIQAALTSSWVSKTYATRVPYSRPMIPLTNQQAVYLALSKQLQAVMTGVKTIDVALADAEKAVKAEFS